MKNRFFGKVDWAAFWTATLVTLAVYFYTLGPSVGLEDSGELATAGAHLGVPHPPGYPFWTLCSWIFCKLFFFVTYMGHPTPAWCISLFSAVAGAFASGCTAMLICRSSRDFVNEHPLLAFGGGVAGALTFALSPVEWSQSTIVEIYSLNAFFLMAVFLLSYRWMCKPSDRVLWFTAFVFGLGLTNYQVLLFAIVPLAIIILMKNIGMFRDVAIFLVPVALTYQVLQIGCMLRANVNMSSDVINKHMAVMSTNACPNSVVIGLAIFILIACIVAAVVLRARGDSRMARNAVLYGGGSAAALVFLAATVFASKHVWEGVSVPLAPLIEPRTYALIGAALIACVTSAVAAACGDEDERPWSARMLPCFAAAIVFAIIAILIAQSVPAAGNLGYRGSVYPWGKSTMIFVGLMVLMFGLCAFTKKGLAFAIPAAAVQISAFILLKSGAMNGLTHPCSWWFCWPIAWNFILLAMCWAILPNGRSVAGAAFFAQLGVSFYVYMPIVSDLRNPPMNWGYPRTWEGFKHAIQRGQYAAITFPSFPTISAFLGFVKQQMWHYFQDVRLQFTDLLIPFSVVPFAIGHWIVAKAQRKTFWQWMIAAAACFMMMSFLLILLADVKGDVQDGFIQKVKFISSHAMIALWIGYGLVFAWAAIFRLCRKSPSLGAFLGGKLVEGVVAGVTILVALVYPIIQNYTDERMVFELGGNEQNKHTFGWQFGAYQLEGAKAINDQLVADEEPLPDPNWPEPMEPFSIFFGGTDPGRFVPTYMIYSADYRPDVYLITQNALADNTYIQVERDLYGDEIWIPSVEDSADAFTIYVDEVKRGVRQANGDLKIENGRVQVTGALGVMEINGIITKMMFDHDRDRHAFYIEESYEIPWMYPYLSPHGLIMKINRDRTPYDAKTARKDADFWDWYVRRLLDDPMYRRDFAAQKSFSKLRTAIAGLYSRQGRAAESAQAYREACLLYPASPESSFRYIRETLLPRGRVDQVLDMLGFTDAVDPHNRRTAPLRDFITKNRNAQATIARLEPKVKENKITPQESIELAVAYAQLNRFHEASLRLIPILDMIRDRDGLAFAWQTLLRAGRGAEAEKMLVRYLAVNPQGDPAAWLELAKLQYRAGRIRDAQQSFVKGYNLDVRAGYDRLNKDKELQEIAAPLFKQRGK